MNLNLNYLINELQEIRKMTKDIYEWSQTSDRMLCKKLDDIYFMLKQREEKLNEEKTHCKNWINVEDDCEKCIIPCLFFKK